MSVLLSWLAQNPAPPPQGPEFGGSSPIGLVVILLMAVALVFLIRSMNKHLRRVPKSFDPPEENTGEAATRGAESPEKPKASNGADPEK